MSTFTDSEVVYDVSGFKHFLSESEFTLDSGEKVSLNAGQVDKVWAKCRSERKSISRGNFVTKVIPEVASLVYKDTGAESQCKVWQGLSRQLVKPQSQDTASASQQQSASSASLPSNTAVYTNAFN
ncbi:uncharacterized protein LOC142341113 [Convolutriloba macropyga]|uniref:uncharacterized protein LOC142341113 n=1 Tax=Convolutriloba macropyga TaxID=536237 RepID=UPI003F5257F1